MDEQVFENGAFLSALADFRQAQTPENEEAFVNATMNAVFMAPVTFSVPPVENAETGEITVDESSEMRLVTLQNDEGHSIFPAFTDPEAFQAQQLEADEDIYAWPMTMPDYFPVVFGEDDLIDGVVVNPFTDGMTFSRDNLAYLAGGAGEGGQTAAQGAADADMQLTDVDEQEIPTPLLAELIGVADDARGEVTEFYVLWLRNEETGVANYLLVVDGPSVDDVKKHFPAFAQAFADKAEEGFQNVDMISRAEFDVDLSEFKPKYVR